MDPHRPLRLTLLLLAAGTPCFAQDFSRQVEAAAAGLLKGASWGFSVKDASTGSRLAQREAERNLVPASSLKLLPTAAAFAALGPEHRFKTRLYRLGPLEADGALRGGLALVGGGDPALGSSLVRGAQPLEELLAGWVRKLQDAGVRRVEGDLVADNRLHEGLPVPGSWSWEDIGNYYAAPADALSINDNLFRIVFAPGSPGDDARLLRLEPEVPGLELVNRMTTGPEGSGDNGFVFNSPGRFTAELRGTVPSGPKEFAIKGALPEPALFAAQALKARLEKAGVSVSGEARLAEAPVRREPSALLLETLSPPLKDIVFITHKRSFNLYAELLARALAVRRGRPGTVEEGLAAVKDHVRGLGVDVSGMRLFDACGLSRSNQLTADSLAGVLAAMSKAKAFGIYRDSLVVPGDPDATGHIKSFGKGLEGRLWTKSGSLAGVRSYAGYLKTRKGRLLAFAFIANNYVCAPAELDRLHERLLAALAAD
ncbi:MAG TPA: D-alanyl-D-alanine carboxypeptidase/D-alanyl-D-alanine-endopeptidase [Elusimicrobia bacterium]|nr:D-alanyl-D-alanine carboxypeptidase/D-alanyl-D-alanine-endopeptidase [Elusimicrobiota bacterium]